MSSKTRSIPRFSSEIEAALAKVMAQHQSGGAAELDDLSQFDAPDFSPVDFVNQKFPDDAALDDGALSGGGLSTFIETVRRRLAETDSQLLEAVKTQAAHAASSAKNLEQSKQSVIRLGSKVEEIKNKADASERQTDAICSSISQLDTAKRNLTESIVTINQLQLFLRATQTLERELKNRNYQEINDSLRQALRYQSRFEQFKDIPKVNELHIKLLSLKRRLSQQVTQDLLADLCPGVRRYSSGADSGSHHGTSSNSNTNSKVQPLGEEGQMQACLVVDALGKDVMSEVRKEYIASLLEEYTSYLFKRGSKEAALERTERRFIWFRQLLEKQERLLLHVFPLHWYVMQELCVEFCMRTAEELTHQLAYEGGGGGVEVAVLIYMLQKTMDVEKDLTSRMKYYEAELKDRIVLEQEARSQREGAAAAATAATVSNSNQQQQQQQQQGGGGSTASLSNSSSSAAAVLSSADFCSPLMPQAPRLVQEYKVFGFIVSVFDRYLDKYVQHEDDTMREEMERIIADDGENGELMVLQSTQDMFLYIQESVRRASTITSERSQSTLTDLCAVWHKHLGEYAGHLQQRADGKKLPPATKEEQHTMCVIVNSADYCRNAAEGLGEDLLRLLEDKAAFAQVHNDIVTGFSKVCTFASTRLADAVCSTLNGFVTDYQTFLASGTFASGSNSSSAASAGAMVDVDESFFPESVRRALSEHYSVFATSLLPNLFSFVITKAAAQFIPRLNRLVYRGGSASGVGGIGGGAGGGKGGGGKLTQAVIAQLRVDIAPTERAFSAAPTIAMNSARDAAQNPFSSGLQRGGPSRNSAAAAASASGEAAFSSAAYTKTVRREFSRIAAALRVLQLPPGERLVEGYCQIVDKEDRSETDCGRLLELLGVSREDLRQWLALLKRRGDVPPQTRRDAAIGMMCGYQMTASPSSASAMTTAAAGGGASSSIGAGAAGGEKSMGNRLAQFFGGGDVHGAPPGGAGTGSSSNNNGMPIRGAPMSPVAPSPPVGTTAAASPSEPQEQSTLDAWKAKFGKWKF